MTVRQFLNQGAGIALQIKQAGATEWTSHATPVYYYHKENGTEMHPPCEVPVFAGDRVQLTCDPFYGQDNVTPGQPITDIFYTRTFDFLQDMPKAPFRGSYTCDVRFEGDDDEVVMNLEVPIFFDYGTRCILPRRRSTPLTEVVPALFEDADGDIDMTD